MDDLISRKHFDERIRTAGGMVWDELSEDCKGAVCAILEMLKTEPSVQPESKTGRWEYVQYDGNPKIGNWHCSECNRIVFGVIRAGNPVYAYKYCPECGAKMKEGDTE